MLIETNASTDGRPGTAEERYFARDFVLDDPEVAWVVDQGNLDLFLVQYDSDGLAGPRRHILRVREGQAAFGLNLAGALPNAKLLATGSPDVHIHKVAVKYLQELQADGTPNASGTGLLESWVRGLTYAVAWSVPPKTYVLSG